jgi:putative Mn2+ efflux pump MntP
MNLAAEALLGIGLAVDSSLVALAYGLAVERDRARTAFEIAIPFGLTQGGLAVAGWYSGGPVAALFSEFDHWVAFAVLAAIGGKIFADALREKIEPRTPRLPAIALSAVATSIDAFAAGFGLALAEQRIAPTAVFAASATALGALACFFGARTVGAKWTRPAHAAAGLLLVGIGASIVWQHLF